MPALLLNPTTPPVYAGELLGLGVAGLLLIVLAALLPSGPRKALAVPLTMLVFHVLLVMASRVASLEGGTLRLVRVVEVFTLFAAIGGSAVILVVDVLISRAHKQGIAPEAFDASKDGAQSGKAWKKQVKVRNGLAQEDAKKIVKLIKDAGLKVQASINDDLVRVTGKKIDDLQEVIQLCKNSNLGIPLQYVNMRS